jgi:serine protease Do
MKSSRAVAIARAPDTRALRLTLIAFLAVVALLIAPLNAYARTTPGSFADLAERLSPAVVNISTAQKVERPSFGPRPGPELPEGTPFEDFFKDFFDKRGGGGGNEPRTVQSLGSGFVIDPAGYIVTNNHVIEGADEITINFANGDALEAKLIGTDPKTDIALLKLIDEPSEPLPFVPFADSDKTRVGDWVIAIGNPFGLGGSVSAGIISARSRDINSGPYDDFLQTDAAINRGNSGGPLFNMDGEVVGVNTAIFSPTGGSVGVGFSVPANIASNIVDQLREFGETRRGWLGVRIRQVTDELAEGLQLEKVTGALVEDVTKDGPAAEAGVEIGDVILSFDGTEITEMRELPRAVAGTPVDETVRMVVSRKGKTQTLKVTVGRLKEAGDDANDKPKVAEKEEEPEAEESFVALGMKLETLDREARERLELDKDLKGALVTDVESTGPAAKKGIQPGDVIVEVAQEAVSTPAAAKEKIDAAEKDGRSSVLLLVNRAGDVRFVAVRFPEDE